MPDTISPSIPGQENVSLITGYGIYDRDIRKKLSMRVPKAGALSWMRKLDNRMEKRYVRRHSYYFYEEGQFFQAAVTIAAANIGVANEVTITLTTADHFSAGAKSWPVVGQMAVFEDETTGYVESINRTTPNAHTVTILEENASQDVQTAGAVGTTVVFYGMAVGEGSTKQEGRVPQFDKITNYIGTTRHGYEVTDFSLQNEVEFEYKEGQRLVYYKGIDDTADTFEMYEELNLFINHGTAAGSVPNAAGDPVKTATGLIPQIDAGGQTLEYYGQPDLTTFEDLELMLDAAYGDTEYLLGTGLNANQGLRKWLVDFTRADGGDTDISFAGMNKQEIGIDLQTVGWGDYKFHLDRWAILSHKDSLGADKLPYRHMIIGIPLGVTLDPGNEGNNFQQKEMPYMCMAYAMPQGSRNVIVDDVMIWEDGALARPGPTSDELVRGVHFVSYKSIEMRNRNKFIIGRDAS